MPYIQRDENNKIVGQYSNLQEGIAEEWLEDNDPEIVLINLTQLKIQKKVELSNIVDMKCTEGFSHGQNKFTMSPSGWLRILSMVTLAESVKDGRRIWNENYALRDVNGSWITLPSENDMESLADAALGFYLSISAKYRQKEAEIDAVTTLEDINTFDPWSGWDE